MKPLLRTPGLLACIAVCLPCCKSPTTDADAPPALRPESAGAPSEESPAAAQDTKDPAALAAEANSLASYSSGRGEILRAHRLAREAYQLSADHALVLAHAALLAAQLTEDIGAKADFARPAFAAVEKAPSNPVTAYYRAVHFGLILQDKGLAAAGKLPEMVEMLELALAKPDTDHSGPDRALGMLYLRAPAWPTGVGDLDLALEHLAAAAGQHPDFPPNQFNYAEALVEDGRSEEAKQSLDRAQAALKAERWNGFREVWTSQISQLRTRIKS